MRFAVGWLLLGLYAGWTAMHVPTFQSDRSLWEAAVKASPLLPRPALNLATAYRKAGLHDAALFWLLRAADLSHRGPRGAEVRAHVRAQLLWMSAFGDDVCSRPTVRFYCS